MHGYIEAIRQVIFLLVHEDFDALEREHLLGPSTKAEYAQALRAFLGNANHLVMPPDAAFEGLIADQAWEEDGRQVDLDLWDQSGLCDLTAKLNVHKSENGRYVVVLYDLRVM